MPRIKETLVYKFEELSDEAKEKARNWWRESGLDYEWWECTFEYVSEVADILGIDLRTRKVRLANGDMRSGCINIEFSGFYSQGDGACFNGTYAYAKDSLKKITKTWPEEHDLQSIAKALQEVQRTANYELRATVSPGARSNFYSHEMTRHIEVWHNVDHDRLTDEMEEGIKEALQDFMRWIYAKLKEEYNYLNSDEQVDEAILANGYEFDENGNRA